MLPASPITCTPTKREMFINAIRKAILTTSRTGKANSKGNSLQRINSNNDSRNRHKPGSSPQPINSSKGSRNKEVRSNKWNVLTRIGVPGHKTITARNSKEVVVVITGRAVQADPEEAEVAAEEGDRLLLSAFCPPFNFIYHYYRRSNTNNQISYRKSKIDNRKSPN